MPTLHDINLDLRLRIARRAAQTAGNTIMTYYGREQTIKTKSSSVDLVTLVDIEADERIREMLQEEFPNETLITEETFQEGQPINLEQAWIIDPLDGTTNYAHGFPHFAVSIAYVEQGKPLVGVIFDPFKNELFTAIAGGESLRNGVPIHVSQTESLSTALLATGFPYNRQTENPKETNVELHSRFLKITHGIRRAGAAALDLAYVACGRLDGFWELRLSPWDVAAGIVLIEQAGGKISGFSGEPLALNQRHINIVGSNTRIHDGIIDVTQRG